MTRPAETPPVPGFRFAASGSAVLFELVTEREDGDRRPFLVPVNVCTAVPETLARAGCEVEFVDLATPELPDVDLARVVDLLRSRPHSYAGVIWVRPYGSLHEPDDLFARLRACLPQGLLVDDRCLGAPDPDLGAPEAGADAVFYSTGNRKVVSLGGGGFGRTRDAGGGALRHHQARSSESTDAYLAAVRRKLDRVESDRGRQRAIYRAAFPEHWRLPDSYQTWRFHLLLDNPDEVRTRLWAHGIPSSRHYGPVAPNGDAFPRALEFQRRVLNLFLDSGTASDGAQRTVELVLTHGRG